MEPPPEVLLRTPCLAPAPSRIRGMAPTMRFSRRHMPCACLRRGITPGGGCLFLSPMLTNEVRYMGTHPSRAQQPPEGGCLRPQNSRLWPPNVRSASRCNRPPGVVAVGAGVYPRVGSPYRLANTGLLKMEPPPEVNPRRKQAQGMASAREPPERGTAQARETKSEAGRPQENLRRRFHLQ